MTSVSKNVYIDKLDDIVNKYNNTYHSTIKMKPVDVKSNTHIDSSKEINDKNPRFKIGDVRISKYKNIFGKGYTPNWSKEVFVFKKLKILYHGHMLTNMFTKFTNYVLQKRIAKNKSKRV